HRPSGLFPPGVCQAARLAGRGALRAPAVRVPVSARTGQQPDGLCDRPVSRGLGGSIGCLRGVHSALGIADVRLRRDSALPWARPGYGCRAWSEADRGGRGRTRSAWHAAHLATDAPRVLIAAGSAALIVLTHSAW